MVPEKITAMHGICDAAFEVRRKGAGGALHTWGKDVRTQ